MRTIVAIFIALAGMASAAAQDMRVFKPNSADAQLRSDTLRKMRDDVNRRDVEAWRGIQTKADWEKFRDERLAKLRASLGTFPPAPTEVKVVTTKTLPGDGFNVECILYESRPGFFVTANLYVPAKTDRPMPGFIVIHSHHNPKTQGELQDMGMNWARQGCLVLIPDMLGHGERRQHGFIDKTSYPGPFKVDRQDYFFRYNTAMQLHLLGESLIGWMVWDLMRGVDVLYQRPNIDKSKIVVFGSVAGGGDPCAVFAALDKRVTAAAPFNFGGPQPETGKLGEDAEFAFNYLGGGSWESTRNLRLSGHDGFLPWLIVGAIAPRGLIYGHEFAWDEKHDPVWARFQKIWGFYGAQDKLASAKGRGSVKGRPPEATHCNNIGPVHRQQIYPTLNKWFGLPIPAKEYQNRFKSSDLQCWTDDARKTLKPKMLHEILAAQADQRRPPKDAFIRPITAMPGDTTLEQLPINVPGLPGRSEAIIVRQTGARPLAVPALLLRPAGKINTTHAVIALAQDGKAGFVKHRAATIAELLKRGVAVCLPDLRGTGETSPDGRGRTSGATSYSASMWMHGQNVMGVQVQELAALMNALQKTGVQSFALWGDSFAEANDPAMRFAVPYDAAKMPRQSEPMGPTVALLGGAFHGAKVRAIYTRGGLVSWRSLLDSPFIYAPHDAVLPGILKWFDIDALTTANAKHGLKMEGQVDGLNRRVDRKAISTPTEVAAWLCAPHASAKRR